MKNLLLSSRFFAFVVSLLAMIIAGLGLDRVINKRALTFLLTMVGVLFSASSFAELTASISLGGAPTSIYPTQDTSISITLANSANVQVDNVALSITLPGSWPSGLRVSGTPSYSCSQANAPVTTSGTLTATLDTNVISLSGGVLPAKASTIDGSCLITVPVTAGNDDNASYEVSIPDGAVTGVVASSPISNAGAVSQTINVLTLNPFTVTESYLNSSVYQEDETTLTVTLENPNPVPITNFNLSDTFNVSAYTEVASIPSASNTCSSSSFNPQSGTSSLSLTGTLPAKVGAINGSCSFSVNIRAIGDNTTASVNSANTLSSISNDLNVFPVLNPATLTIGSALAITERIGSINTNSIYAGSTQSLTITLENRSSNLDLTGVGFSLMDHIRRGTSVSSPVARGLSFSNEVSSCGGTAGSSGTTLTLAGASVPKGGTCTITADYVVYTNAGSTSSSYFYGVMPVGLVTTSENVFSPAFNTWSNPYTRLSILSPLYVEQQWLGASNPGYSTTMLAGDSKTLTVSLINKSTNPISIASFTKDPIDGLTGSHPAYGLGVTNTVTNCVGGSVATATSGYGFTLTGGTVPAHNGSNDGSCTVTVTFTGVLPDGVGSRSYSNSILTGAVATSDGFHVSRTGASGTLTVKSPLQSSIEYVLTDNTAITTLTSGSTGRMKLTLSNTGAIDVTAVNLALDPILKSGTAAENLTISTVDASSCTGATLSNTSTGISLSGVSFLAGGSCIVTIDFTATPRVGANSTLYSGQILSSGTAGTNAILSGTLNSNPVIGQGSSANLTVTDSIKVTKYQAPSYPYPSVAGNPIKYTVYVDNYDSSSAQSNVSVTDHLSGGLTYLTGMINGHDFSPTLSGTGCGANTTPTSGNTTGNTDVTITIPNINVANAGSYSRCTLNFWAMVPTNATKATYNSSTSLYKNKISTGDACAGGVNGSPCNGGDSNLSYVYRITDPLSAGISYYRYNFSNSTYTSTSSTGYTGSPLRIKTYLYNYTLNDLTDITLSGLLPTSNLEGNQLQIADFVDFSTSCGSATSIPQAGETNVAISGLTVPARLDNGTSNLTSSCYVQFNVSGGQGSYLPSFTVAGATGAYSDSLTPVIYADVSSSRNLTLYSALSGLLTFSDTTLVTGQRTTATVRITNSSLGPALMGNIALSNTLPAGMTLSNPSNARSSCDGAVSITANAGSNSVQLSGAQLARSTNCQLIYDVDVNFPGGIGSTLTDTIAQGELSAENGDITASSFSRAVTRVAAPSDNIIVAMSANPSSLTFPGQVSRLQIELTSSSTDQTVSAINLKDYFTEDGTNTGILTGVVVAPSPQASTNCTGGLVTANAGESSIELAEASLNPGETCSYSVNLLSTNVGGKTLTIPANTITTQQAVTNSNFATTSIAIGSNIGVLKSFSPQVVVPNQRSRLRLTFFNPSNLPMSELTATDNLPVGLVVPAGALPFSTCQGLNIATPTESQIVLTNGTVEAAPGDGSSSTCYMEIDVVASAVGEYENIIATAGVSAVVAGSISANSQPATAILLVASPLVAHLGIQHSGAEYRNIDPGTLPTSWTSGIVSVKPGTYKTFKILIENTNVAAVSNMAFRLDLPEGILLYSSPSVTNTCSGTIEALSNTSFLRLSSGSITALSSCEITFRAYSNVAGQLFTPSLAAGAITTFEGVRNAEPTTASLEILDKPSVAVEFSPPVITPGANSRMTISLNNPNLTDITLNGKDFRNTLPSGVKIAATPDIQTTCNEGLTNYVYAYAGNSYVELNYYYYNPGFKYSLIPAGGCTISVNVTAADAGLYVNSIAPEQLDTTAGKNETGASAVLIANSTGYVSGRVFMDNDVTPDGVFNINTDTPLVGATIELHQAVDCSGTATQSTITTELGVYTFFNLTAGTYSLCQNEQPVGTINGITTAGAIVAVNGSTGAVGTASNPTVSSSEIINIVINADGASSETSGSTGNNFAELAISSISGTVFSDVDNNGIQNGADDGIAGVTINLIGANGVDIVTTTTSDANGHYIFTGLVPSTYYLEQPTQPINTSNGETIAGLVPNGGSTDTVTALGVTPSRIGVITLPPNTNASGFNFAEIPNSRIIYGLVFLDRDNDGFFNGSDSALAGSTLNLDGTDINGNTISDSLTSGADGSYAFIDLPEGTYSITQTAQPTDTLSGVTRVGSTGGVATTFDVSPSVISGIVLTGSNSISAENNFAELPIVAPDLVVDIVPEPAAFDVGLGAGSFTVTPANSGDADTTATNIVVTTLPAGLTPVSATGVGWTCAIVAQVVTCSSNAVIPFSDIGLPITINTDVDPNSHANILVTTAVISGGGEPGSFTTNNISSVPVTIVGTGAVNGLVFTDTNRNDTYDAGEPKLPGYIVKIYDGGTLLQTGTTDANGVYTFIGILPGDYKLRFYTPADQIIVGRGNVAPSEVYGMIDVTITPGGELVAESMPVPADPSGIIYDSITRLPVSGATVTITGPVGFNAATHTVSGSATYTTLSDGRYEFWLTPTAPSGNYTLEVTTYPAGYLVAPSAVIPVCTNTPTVNAVPPAGFVDASVHANPTPPIIGASIHNPATCPADSSGWGLADTTYYSSFNITIGGPGQSADTINNHIPIDPEVTNAFMALSKAASARNVELGDSVGYTLKFNHQSGAPQSDVTITDTLPRGFKYIPNTVRIVVSGSRNETLTGDAVAGVTGVGPVLNFNMGNLVKDDEVIVNYRVRVGVGALQGDGINRAQAISSGGISSNEATAKVNVSEGVFTSNGCLIGKIYLDCNGNGIQDADGEVGIPGVRFYLEDGTYIISDAEGKYSLCDMTPTTHVIKVDPITLPEGAVLHVSSNRNAGVPDSLFVDMKFGELHRADFIEGGCSDELVTNVMARREQAVKGLDGVAQGAWPSFGQVPTLTKPSTDPSQIQVDTLGKEKRQDIKIRFNSKSQRHTECRGLKSSASNIARCGRQDKRQSTAVNGGLR